MIERRSRPIGSRMANRTILREPRRNVIRNPDDVCCRELPRRYMATVTGCGTERVVVPYVTGNAGRWRRGNMQSR